jgi:hypothetical protein
LNLKIDLKDVHLNKVESKNRPKRCPCNKVESKNRPKRCPCNKVESKIDLKDVHVLKLNLKST